MLNIVLYYLQTDLLNDYNNAFMEKFLNDLFPATKLRYINFR